MEIKAELNYLRMAPRKVRLVAGFLRGMNVNDAEIELQHMSKRAASVLYKLLRSAIANARQNFQTDAANLYIKKIIVNQGPVLKRMRPRAFGRAAFIQKKMSRILIVLDTHGTDKTMRPRRELRKKEGPIVRDVIAEDLREESVEKFKGEKEKSERVKPKKPGFVRRVFQRKAI